jgi:hypothetical protein
MSKVITFSRTFPAYHPKAGQPTYFVEKFWKSLWDQNKAHDIHLFQEPYDEHFHPWGDGSTNVHQYSGKHHTIRAGSRWKEGDYFSPRVWSGKPYNSKQIIIGPNTQIVKEYSFEIQGGEFKIDDRVYGGEAESIFELLELIALNDGLNRHDLLEWFKYPKPFDGQILCWNENIKY